MSADETSSVLRQMARARTPVAPDVPLTASRAIRLALTRAAERSVGLVLNVISVAEDAQSLDDLAGALSDDHLMIALTRGDTIGGLMACDFQFGAAAVEVQTTGKVLATAPATRKLTGVDQSLVFPLLARFLSELELTTPRTALDGWADGAMLGHRFAEVRRIGFDLQDLSYRLIKMSIDFGIPDRTATLMMAMPMQTSAIAVKPKTPATLDWDTHFQAAVRKAPATLDAVLHQFDLPLTVATNLAVGQVIPMPGCTVGAVRLVAPGGRVIANAKLGQVAGQIAVRLDSDVARPMTDMPQVARGAPAPDVLVTAEE